MEAPEEIRTLRPEELQEATKDSEACGTKVKFGEPLWNL